MGSVGQILKKLRAKKGMVIRELAEKSGLDKSTINEIENDKQKDIKLETLLKLAKGLDVKPSELLDDDGEISFEDVFGYVKRYTANTSAEKDLLDGFRKAGEIMKPLVLYFLTRKKEYAMMVQEKAQTPELKTELEIVKKSLSSLKP